MVFFVWVVVVEAQRDMADCSAWISEQEVVNSGLLIESCTIFEWN